MTPAQLTTLKSEIDNDPTSVGYLSIPTYKGLADALNAATQESDRIQTRDIFDYLAATRHKENDAEVIPLIGRVGMIAALSEGASNPFITGGTLTVAHVAAAKALLELVNVETVTGSSDGYQSMTTQLGDCRALSIAQRNALRDLGLNKTSRATILGLPYVRGINVESSGVVR